KLERERPRISFPEYQREKTLWPAEKKCMLIDSIVKEIDIPKLYFNEPTRGSYEVIDGQQRLWSVWEYLGDQYACVIEGQKKRFSALSRTQRRAIEEYTFQITIFEDAEEDYLGDLFVRLQLGLLLNAGEKLHAASGRMKNFVFGSLASNKFV